MKYCRKYVSPVGELTIVSDGKYLTGLLFEKEMAGADYCETDVPESAEKIMDVAELWLDKYFAGEKVNLPKFPKLTVGGKKIELLPEGTEFAMEVWKMLCEIPYGESVTYGDIARRMAVICGKNRMSAQAVGGAVGSNPISLIIPCHRVLGFGGKLTGYGGGIENKAWLLDHEGIEYKG